MTTATLTSKGRMTLPKAIRDRLRLKPGDRIDFDFDDGGDVIMRPVTRSALDMIGFMRRSGRKPMSVAAIDAAIGRHCVDKIRRLAHARAVRSRRRSA